MSIGLVIFVLSDYYSFLEDEEQIAEAVYFHLFMRKRAAHFMDMR